MTETQTEQIVQILRAEYEQLDSEEAILPALLAARAQKRMDPKGATPPLMAWAAVLELRQLAREVCRGKSELDREDNAPEAEQGNLFDAQLQRRYPAERNGSEAYVKRSMLTLAERKENSRRLRAEGMAKIKHADALDAETESLIESGMLVKESA